MGYLVTHDIQSAVSILLVAAPCALAIATPAAVSTAMSNMTRKGVFIKGGTYFEAAGKLDAFMLDKTGTLTTGVPTVSGVWAAEGLQAEEVLYWAASAEQGSRHPFAKALRQEADKRKITLAKASSFMSITGLGVKAVVDGNAVVVGRPDDIKDLCSFPDNLLDQIFLYKKERYSCAAVAVNDRLYGTSFFEDQVRRNAKQSIEWLQQMVGRDHVILLSGDRQKAAETFGNKVGISQIFGGLMPVDKKILWSGIKNRECRLECWGMESTTRLH